MTRVGNFGDESTYIILVFGNWGLCLDLWVPFLHQLFKSSSLGELFWRGFFYKDIIYGCPNTLHEKSIVPKVRAVYVES